MEHLPIVITNRDPRFYPLLGPFLSRREIVYELGDSIYDDDDKVWFVVLDDGKVVGFAALTLQNGVGRLKSAYVLPNHRRQGIYTALLQSRLAYAKEQGCTLVKTTARPDAARVLARFGFIGKGNPLKYYTRMEKSLE